MPLLKKNSLGRATSEDFWKAVKKSNCPRKQIHEENLTLKTCNIYSSEEIVKIHKKCTTISTYEYLLLEPEVDPDFQDSPNMVAK